MMMTHGTNWIRKAVSRSLWFSTLIWASLVRPDVLVEQLLVELVGLRDRRDVTVELDHGLILRILDNGCLAVEAAADLHAGGDVFHDGPGFHGSQQIAELDLPGGAAVVVLKDDEQRDGQADQDGPGKRVAAESAQAVRGSAFLPFGP